MVNLPLLQKILPSIQKGDPGESWTILIVLVAIIVAMVLASRIKPSSSSRSGSSYGSGSGRKPAPRKFNKRTFHKRAMRLGLSKVQANTLVNLVENYKPSNPNLVFTHSSHLDSLLRKAIQEIEHQVASEQVKEAQKTTVYRIKQAIERNVGKGKSFSATGAIPTGQHIAVTPENGGRYQSKINANLKNYLSATLPVDSFGSEIKWKKWTPVKVFFWKKNGQGFSFDSKVTGYSNIKGMPSVLLQHSGKVKQAQQRRFRRKELSRPAYFYPVKVIPVGVGKKAKKRAIVETDRGSLGTLIDVSAGGCAVKSTKPVLKGGLIKLQFETGDSSSIWCFGKVINFRKGSPLGGTMHIMFTKVTQKNLNSINSFIYDY